MIRDVLTNSGTPIEFASNSPINNTWHPLLAAENFVYRGRNVNVTVESLISMVDIFKSGDLGPRLPVTIAHPEIESTKAESWIVDLDVREKTLWAKFEWKPKLEKEIRNKDWAYLSPLFLMSWTDSHGVNRGPALFAAGVTNSPFWKTQPELWNAFTAGLLPPVKVTVAKKEEKKMDHEKMIAELTAKLAEAEKKLQAKETEVNAFTSQMTEQSNKVVALTAKLESIEKANHEREVKAAVDGAIANGKITKAQEKVFIELANVDLVRFCAIVDSLPGKPLPTDEKGSNANKFVAMSDADIIKMCKDYSEKNKVSYSEAHIAVQAAIAEGREVA